MSLGAAVVTLGPELPARGRVDELRIDTDLVTGPAHAAFQHVAHAQLLRRPRAPSARALEGKDRVPGDDEQPRDLRQVGDEVLGHAVDEVRLLRIAAQIRERQDGERRLIG